MNTLRVQLLHPQAIAPHRATAGAAGYDVFALEELSFFPGEQKAVPLGFATSFDAGHVGILHERSSLGKLGLLLLGGVIDADYRGEWAVMLRNLSGTWIKVPYGQAIAQVMFFRHESPKVTVVDALDQTARGTGGFGSTDLSRRAA